MDILTIILAREVLLLNRQDAHPKEVNYLSGENPITTAAMVIILDMAILVILDQDMDILVIPAILVMDIQVMVILVIIYPKISVNFSHHYKKFYYCA